MKVYSVFDKEFKKYGKVIEGYDTKSIINALKEHTPIPDGVEYVPSEKYLEELPVAKQIEANFFGGMPCQLGWCNGHNTMLNCLEYHRDSELNLGVNDFVLLVATLEDMEEGMLDTKHVMAFHCPGNTLVEVYATTLHYAPCHVEDEGFQVLVGLPKGTNTQKPDIEVLDNEDKSLWAKNKWLLAHPDSSEANSGAYIGLKGKNISI